MILSSSDLSKFLDSDGLPFPGVQLNDVRIFSFIFNCKSWTKYL